MGSRLGGQETGWCEDAGLDSTRRRKKTSSEEMVQWRGVVVVRQPAVAPASVVCRYHKQDTRWAGCLAAKARICGAPGRAAATKQAVVAAWTCPGVGAQGRDKVNNGVCAAVLSGAVRCDGTIATICPDKEGTDSSARPKNGVGGEWVD